MLLTDYPILIDENISPAAAEFLRAAFADSVYVRETELTGKGDETLIEYALSENRIIFTSDKSFGNFYRRIVTEKIGVVFIRPGHVVSGITILVLKALIEHQISVKLPFVIIAELQKDIVKIRIRTW